MSTQTRIIRLTEVIEIVGLGKSSIYALMKKGDFPKQIKLGARASGWIESEIDEWIETRVNKSRAVV